MRLETTDPIELLNAARMAAETRLAVDEDFISPSGTETLHIVVPEPGVVHPAHRALLAECIGETVEWVDHTLEEGTPDDASGVRAMATALRQARGPGSDRLRAMGIKPEELVLRHIPIAPGRARPNPYRLGSNPVLSSENAALLMFHRRCKRLAHRIDLQCPSFILDNDANVVQRSFRELHDVVQGCGPGFAAFDEGLTDPPRSASLIAPPRIGSWVGAPLRPLQVALAGSTAVVRFPGAIARIDVRTGEFSTHPIADAALLAIVEGRALFRDGVQIVVFDTNNNDFAAYAPSIPRRVVVGACCGISVLDTDTRMVATMPGPLASAAFDVVTSACGRYGWLEIAPQQDDVGVFSIERLESVVQPWPHPKLGRPALNGDPGEGHDDVARALVRLPGGAFRCLYGEYVLDAAAAHRLPTTPLAGAFDAGGDELTTVDASELRCYALGVEGHPELKCVWSLRALVPHLSARALDLEASGLDEGRLMGVAGTMGALAALTPEELTSRLLLESDPSLHAAFAQLIAAAGEVHWPRALERID
jgi:hypothetical protein